MKSLKFQYILLAFSIFALVCHAQPSAMKKQSLASGFAHVPDSIQTSIYWYWISDHISEKGVIDDLKAMKEAGINRAFIGNIGLNKNESGVGKVKFNTEEWWKILHTALKTATELGIDIGIFNSPGWSQSGGPWVKPEQAMRYLAYTKTKISGGKEINVELPLPKSNYAGSFQDVKVIAYPAMEGDDLRLTASNASANATPGVKDINKILDWANDVDVVLANPGGNTKEVAIDFKSKIPFTLRSLKIYATHVPIDCPAKIQVKENGQYRTLHEFPISRFNPNPNVGFDPYAPVAVSVSATTSQEFRLVISNINPGAGLRHVELSSAPIVERYPEKSLAKMHQTPLPFWGDYLWRPQPEVDNRSLLVSPSDIVDISKFFDGKNLKWKAPKGEWVVLRTGMLPTGVTNAPASPEATGLETDKMSKKHIEAHFEAYMAEIYRRIPEKDRKSWKIVVQDSYETGGQNFTDNFLAEFKNRYGYDATPFLPVFSGVVVGNEDISDRFLWDLRRLVADKVAYDYVGGLRDVSHKYGLTTWLENYGHWGFPGEFLQYGAQSDEIGGEFWSEGSLGDIENRAASSCGHIYGKNKISAESFTAGGGGYHRYPAMMKQRGDRFFTEGINNTLLHLYISQPYADKEPGVNAAFGNEFNKKNTWFPHMDLFTTYIKRVNFMLRQGLNIADVAYFIGEDAPKMTGITDPALPKGYQFDYINAEVILRDMTVKEGLLTLPHGTQYRILVLPKLETMRPELLDQLEKLLNDGAVILGSAPRRSPSYQDYPDADKKVASKARKLWGKIDPEKKFAKIGKGMLMDGLTLPQAMAIIDCVPDCKLADADPVLYGHRKLGDCEIYFVSNQEDKQISFTPEFRVTGMQPEIWDATTGKVRSLPSFQTTAKGTIIPLQLEAYESAFIVFWDKAVTSGNNLSVALNFPRPSIVKKLGGPWTILFDKQKRGPEKPIVVDKLKDLTAFDDENIKHYAGTLVYTTEAIMPRLNPGETYFLNLNEVYAMAKIKINGQFAGGVWTAPYSVDITKALREGKNKIEIEVTTTWKNRLIGDLKLPEEQRKTWVAFQPWKPTDSLQKMGLIGPVQIESFSFQKMK